MPYESNKDLPESVTAHLPEHAQTIFREAFNSAQEKYGSEMRALKVAWAAVKNEYEKNLKGEWVKK